VPLAAPRGALVEGAMAAAVMVAVLVGLLARVVVLAAVVRAAAGRAAGRAAARAVGWAVVTVEGRPPHKSSRCSPSSCHSRAISTHCPICASDRGTVWWGRAIPLSNSQSRRPSRRPRLGCPLHRATSTPYPRHRRVRRSTRANCRAARWSPYATWRGCSGPRGGHPGFRTPVWPLPS
jgi:hypothetical protein